MAFPVFVKWKLCKVMNSRAIALEDIAPKTFKCVNVKYCAFLLKVFKDYPRVSSEHRYA